TQENSDLRGERRRAAYGRGDEHATGSIYNGDRGGAFRRPLKHDVGSVSTPHHYGIRRMGKSGGSKIFRLHGFLFAIRQRSGQAVSEPAGHGRVERFSRELLGTCEMGSQAA